MPGKKQVRVDSSKRLPLIGKKVKRLTRVEFRIVDLSSDQAAVLIVLDQLVVGVGRKRQGAQTQSVQHRHAEHAHVRCSSFEVPYVEVNQVVADETVAGLGEFIKLSQRRTQSIVAQFSSVNASAAPVPRRRQREQESVRRVPRLPGRLRCSALTGRLPMTRPIVQNGIPDLEAGLSSALDRHSLGNEKVV